MLSETERGTLRDMLHHIDMAERFALPADQRH
jgi:hypothetical protein